MPKAPKTSAHFPQGTTVKLYLDDGSTQDYETKSIKYELLPQGIAICTYNTPKNMNALSANQRWECFILLEHMKRDDNVKIAIWTGSGDKCFNAGADLKFDRTVYLDENIQEQYLARKMGPIAGDWVLTNDTKAFWDFPKPSIAAINGLAVGGAANIALMNYHDLVICSDKARFMWPFPKLGFIPELGSSLMMAQTLGIARTKEVMFLSDWIDAKKAVELGLANKVVASEKLMEAAIEVAERLLVLPPAALMYSKKILNAPFREKLDETLAREQENFVKAMEITGGPMMSGGYIKEQTEWLRKVKAKL